MNFLQRIGQALSKPVFSGTGGASGLGTWNSATVARLLGMPIVDAERDVGELWKSSIPFMCLKWEQRASIELELTVQKVDENGDWMNVPNHRALEILRNPNPFFSTAQLFDAIRWDFHLDGNAYLYKERSGSGRTARLWWVPSWMIDPRWEEDGAAFISCYEYRVDGKTFAIPVKDIVHFRNGIDPRWQGRKGLSEFAAVHREVMTDDESATLVASLVKNSGRPGVIISPKGGAVGAGQTLQKNERAELREYWEENFTGNNQGRPFIHNIPIQIDFPSYSPQQLILDKVRAIPEQRIAGSFGIPLSVLQLGSGLANSNSRANKSDDREQAYESCIIPTSLALADQLTRSFLSEFCNIANYRVRFDFSNVRCLQEDEGKLVDTMIKATGGPILTVNEGRKRVGYKPVEGGNVLRSGKAQTKEKPSTDEGDDETTDENEPGGEATAEDKDTNDES